MHDMEVENCTRKGLISPLAQYPSLRALPQLPRFSCMKLVDELNKHEGMQCKHVFSKVMSPFGEESIRAANVEPTFEDPKL